MTRLKTFFKREPYEPEPEEQEDERDCYSCRGDGFEKTWNKKKSRWDNAGPCLVCLGTGKLSGPLTREEKDLIEGAKEDAAEQKYEAMMERKYFDKD